MALATILRPVSVVACVQSPGTCDRSAACTARGAWAEVEGKVKEAMGGITLQHLLEQQSRQEQASSQYEI